ncbi:MAG: hypothetical protein KDD37_04290 [Bdellovibrionales bacterium]|nr:hypothetical protein [Bdellovibrionales bacterium]
MIFLLIFYTHAAYFFKEPNSAFPSGYAPTKDLERNIAEKRAENWYRVSHLNKYFWVREDSVVLKKDLMGQVKLERDEAISEKPEGKVTSKIAKGIYPVCDRQQKWIKLCNSGWLQSPFVQWLPNIEGSFVLTLKNTNLFLKPDLLYPIQMVPEHFKARVLKEEKDFFLVQALNRKAYLKKDDTLNVEQFIHGDVYLSPLLVAAKPDIEEGRTENIKGEVFVNQMEERQIEWMKSSVSGHGMVWWKEERQAKEPQVSLFHVKDIMSKKVFDIAKHPKKSLTVVSADGVYRSFDGENWEKIDRFQNQNFAVAFSPSGELFVGDSKSYDLGQKFERFVRWDQIIRDLKLNSDVHDFSIQEISFDAGAIVLHVKKQKLDFYISSRDDGKTWKPYQKQSPNLIDTL